MPPNLHQLLKAMLDKGASDLHITTGSPPQLRIDGFLHPLRTEPLSPVDTKQLCYSILTDAQKLRFEEDNELDLSFGVKNLARFRANVFMQRGAVAGAFRMIPFKIVPLVELGLPPVVDELCNRPRGLVLVTGPTGSGKSTTLASMIDKINSETRDHIITIEDPIEFVHKSKKCLVNQRELGVHTLSFANALKSALREDPDIILVGEMRDLETIQLALTAAETGHLVFGTLHTSSAPKTIDRIIDAFPPAQQAQIRTQLSEALEAVITQTLLKKKSGGRVAALEIMVATTAVRNLIREAKLHQIPGIMQASQKDGMQTMDMALTELVTRGVVHKVEAQSRSMNPNLFGQASAGAA
jgi:twitching motility protein PilT